MLPLVDPRAPSRRASAPSEGREPAAVGLPLAFMLAGLTALCLGMGVLAARPDILATYHYNQYVIAATHLIVLGGICTIVMGAMYQLVPVALETRLHSPSLAWWQLAFHTVGAAGMVWMFWIWNLKQVGHFGSVLAAGVGLFVYNMARTLRRVPKWSTTATAAAAALFWLSLTVLAGLAIAAGKCAYESTEGLATAQGVRTVVGGLRAVAALMSRFDAIGAMHAHAHLGGIGCFVMLLVGVSYKLIPMFTLSELQSPRRAAWSIALLNLGLAGSFATILLRSPWKLLFALTTIAALAIYGVELLAMLRARKRRVLDWGIRSFLTAVALLVPLSALAVVLSWPGLPLNPLTGQLENLYGFLGLVGVVTFAIIGMLYKIIPFLVWFGTYSRQIGRAPVPALADLYSERLQIAGYFTYLAGLATAGAGIVSAQSATVRCGGLLLAASLLTLVLNAALMLRHFFHPKPAPDATRVLAAGAQA